MNKSMEISPKIICAYALNLDAVYSVVGEDISHLANGLLPEAREKIVSLVDLVSALLFCMQKGSGVELLIESEDVAKEIEASFQWKYRLGGNAGIMANVLATLGARPILNAPALSPRLAEMLHPLVRVPVAGVLREPHHAVIDREMKHFVFQFVEGDAVNTTDGKIFVPKNDRLIATFDPLNTRLFSTPDFDTYCQKKIHDFDGALVSGFHLVPHSIYEKAFEKKIVQIKSWKESHPQIFIHAEMGSFQNPEIMLHLLRHLPVDSVGLNEDELAKAQDLSPGWIGAMEAVMHLRDELGLSRVAVHTRDYIMSVMKGLIAPEDEVRALRCGADAAAALAASGSIEGQLPKEVNPAGLKAREEFILAGATSSDRGTYLDSGGVVVSLVPSLLARQPKFTVGLGDTATAAAFYEEVLAIKKRPLFDASIRGG
jgi:ADP-dependent phosphofructokinase/glucokinase